ncbi:NAD-dependent epimerase/dehydratase family protein [Nocardia vulneris]|uniref:NAD-dependent epimerase/dehydratase family protein n=1 Tax=Nocardia vulneris TaxID=1141657 RepID=UPI0030CAF48C
MRVLVTGANGYLGGAVVAALRSGGHEVVGMVRREGAGVPPGVTDVPPGVPVRCADLRDTAALGAAVRDVDVVCHLAGRTRVRESFADPLGYFEVNAGGTVALLRAMGECGARKLVFASTAAIYGAPEVQPMSEDLPDRPSHPYAASKSAAESVIAAHAATGAVDAIVLRLFNIAGGDDRDPTRIIPRILAAAAGESPMPAVNGDGSAVRDYVHIHDAAQAFVAAVDRDAPVPCRTYNIGSETGTSVNELIAAAHEVTGRPIPVEYRSAQPEPPRLISDCTRAHRELGWTPTHSAIPTILRDAWSARPTPPSS